MLYNEFTTVKNKMKTAKYTAFLSLFVLLLLMQIVEFDKI